MKPVNKFTKRQIDSVLKKGQKAWGVTEWSVKWEWGQCQYEGEIEFRFTEKTALITLNKNIPDRQTLVRTVYHEVGHLVLQIIERNLSDFSEHYIKDKTARKVFDERLNTDENIVIDHIVTKVMGV